jgi:hypothetical protein
MRDPLEKWKKRHGYANNPDEENDLFISTKRKWYQDLTLIEGLIIFQIVLILCSMFALPLFLLVMYFVYPPINYSDYEAERKQRIEQIKQNQENSF